MFSHKNNVLLLSVFLIFMALGFFRAQNAFENKYVSLAHSGDGHGTIASFADYNKGLLDKDGCWKLFVDRWNPGLGGGFHQPGVVSIFWKFIGLLFSILEPDDLYDMCVVLIFALNGLTAYLFARYIRLSHYYSLMCALFLSVWKILIQELQDTLHWLHISGLLSQLFFYLKQQKIQFLLKKRSYSVLL